MFSKGNKESKTDTNPNIGNFVPPNPTEIDSDLEPSSVPIPDNVMDKEQIQTVKLVEKISSILSPYFIVIVGLYLSDDSFLIGFVLIVIGILSLLKISLQDIVALIDKAKNAIGGKDS